MPSPLQAVTFRLEADLVAGLRQVRVRDGILATEQVRRALQVWLKSKGVIVELNASNGRRRRRRTRSK